VPIGVAAQWARSHDRSNFQLRENQHIPYVSSEQTSLRPPLIDEFGTSERPKAETLEALLVGESFLNRLLLLYKYSGDLVRQSQAPRNVGSGGCDCAKQVDKIH